MNDLPVPHPLHDGRCTCGCHKYDRETYRPVGGYCPMGCGQTLGISVWPKTNDPSMVACFSFTCPDPRALERILRDPEVEHTVTFSGSLGFTIRHPLRERIDNRLMDCGLLDWLTTHRPDAADTPGVYRATTDEDRWAFTLLHPEEVVR